MYNNFMWQILGDPNQEITPDETQLLLDRLAEMMDSLEWDWFLSADILRVHQPTHCNRHLNSVG